MILTRPQRIALKRLYDRGPIYKDRDAYLRSLRRPNNYVDMSPSEQWAVDKELRILDWDAATISYREFRRKVRPMVADTCVMVPWCGMWVGIEADGYTHS
jgi:hypothetical protein